jgi:hypothetical protein
MYKKKFPLYRAKVYFDFIRKNSKFDHGNKSAIQTYFALFSTA